MKKKKKFNLKSLKFDKQGLIPAIIQDYKTGEVLMLAYMNESSLRKTLKLGQTCFWSRKRLEYWIKGATSGNYQFVKSIAYDCDLDALLIKVRQVGVACHTGNRSCFYRKIE
jgi:phosphoribosyl-AMP cyclohydrolase